jgi:hypothetical protein
MAKAKSNGSKSASSGQPETTATPPLLLHPAAEQALAAVGRVADELARLNTSMDRLIAAKGEGVRPAVEALAEQLIAFLDATGGDPDLELDDEGDGEADDEPSLGAGESVDQQRAWSLGQNPGNDCEHEDEEGDELDTGEISELEHYGESDGDNIMGYGTVDDEPSLGSLDGRMSQLRWSQPDRSVLWPNDDLEHDEAEHEVGIEDMAHE